MIPPKAERLARVIEHYSGSPAQKLFCAECKEWGKSYVLETLPNGAAVQEYNSWSKAKSKYNDLK